MLVAAAALGVGIALAARLEQTSVPAWSVVVLIVLLASGVSQVIRPRRILTTRRLRTTCLLLVAVAAFGGQRYAVWTAGADADLSTLAKESEAFEHSVPLTLVGHVVGSATRTDRRTQFRLRVDSVGFDEQVATQGMAEITVWQPHPPEPPVVLPDIQPGFQVQVSGVLRPLPERRNPADFDYGAHLRRRGVHAVVSGDAIDPVVVLSTATNWRDRALAVARGHVRRSLATHVPGESSRAILEALLLADRSGISPEVRATFSRTGLAHLLAVSGLHVFLVGMVIHGLLKPMLHRLRLSWRSVEFTRAGLTLVILGSYVAVVGAPPSATRALVMATALILGKVMERPANTLNSLGAAALVLLIAWPVGLFDVGFQLSFAAVGAIVILVPELERLMPRGWRDRFFLREIGGSTIVSLAATLGTMPVLMAHFGILPIGGVLLNVLAIPTTGLTLSSGLVIVLFHDTIPVLAGAAGVSADLAARFLLQTGLVGHDLLGWTAVDAYVRDAAGIGFLTLGVITIALMSRPRHRWRSTVATLGCACVLVWQPMLNGRDGATLEAVFFDVGQGDAVLVRLPNGRTLLYDAGPADPFGDAGERVILPHLERFGIRHLDAIVVSHPHSDHIGGVASVVENVSVGAYFDNGEEFDSEVYRGAIDGLDRHLVPRRRLTAGDDLELDADVRIHVLHPGPEPAGSTNDGSVVLLIGYGDVRILLAGDIEAEAEARILRRYGEVLCSDVVKVAHHGSRTSSTAEFVEAIAQCGTARKVVIQSGRRNPFGHPHEEVLDRWRETESILTKTAHSGAIWLRTDGRSVERVLWR